MSEESAKNTGEAGARARAGGGGNGRGWLLAAFILSLALNMLFIGAMIGARWQERRLGSPPEPWRLAARAPLPRPGVVEMIAARRLLRALPAKRRRELRRELLAGRPRLREVVGDIARLRAQLAETLRREPENVEKARAIWRELLRTRLEIHRWQRAAWERFSSALTPAERRRLGAIMERIIARRQWRPR